MLIATSSQPDTDALLKLIEKYLKDTEGIVPPVTQPFNYTASIMNNELAYSAMLCYVLYIYLRRSRHPLTAARSSDSPEDDQQLSLDPLDDDPLVDDPQAEDDEDAEEEPTAAEIVEAEVSRGQLDSDTTIPVDQRAVDEAEERLIQHFAQDSYKCDLGPNRSPCCTTVTAEHFCSIRCQML